MTHVDDKRELRISQFLDEALADLRRPQPLGVAAWQERYPDLADEIPALLETLRNVTTAVDDWKGAATVAEEPPTVAPLEPLPEKIGRYRILKQLGAGGMGTVYEAEDPELKRIVALKVPHFHGSPLQRSTARQRFLREGSAAARIRHPHVCPIHDVGEHEGTPFVVMAYVEGQSLAERLRDLGRFDDPRQAVSLIRQVAEALEIVHGHGVIHRDLKPANILLDARGQAVLTDFGLARPESGDEHLTAEGVLVGTPSYMAPEQAAGDLKNISPRTDLYSLGVVLYQMLTGRLPFEGPQLAVLGKIAHETPPRPAQLRTDLDSNLETIVTKLMARRPEERFANAHELTVTLDRWLAGTPVCGLAQGRVPRKLPGLRTLSLAAGVVLVVVLIAAQIIIRIKNRDGSELELQIPVAAPAAAVPPEKLDAVVQRLQMSTKRPIRTATNDTETLLRIAEIPGDTTTVLLTPLKPGTTRLTMTDRDGIQETYRVTMRAEGNTLVAQAAAVQQAPQGASVPVASQYLPSGLLLSEPEKVFRLRNYVALKEPDDVITSLAELRGKRLRRPLPDGESCRAEDLATESPPSSSELAQGMRAVNLRFREESVLGGVVSVGARVDVFTVHTRNGADLSALSVIENAPILAVNVENAGPVEPPAGHLMMIHNGESTRRVQFALDKDGKDAPRQIIPAPPPATINYTVTLAVSPIEAQRMALVEDLGSLVIVGRLPRGDPAGSLRSVALRLSIEGALGGRLPAQSHVDVVSVVPRAEQNAAVRILLQDVVLLGMKQIVLKKSSMSTVQVATLAVPLDAISPLILAMRAGELRLLLRPLTGDSPKVEKSKEPHDLAQFIPDGKRAISLRLAGEARPRAQSDLSAMRRRPDGIMESRVVVRSAQLIAVLPIQGDQVRQDVHLLVTLTMPPAQAELVLREATASGVELILRPTDQPVAIGKGKRAVIIRPHAPAPGMAGFLMPNSRVDVEFTARNARDDKVILFKDLRVLAVGMIPTEKDQEFQVTLEVDPDQAHRLALASELGTLRLLVRPMERKKE